MIFIYMRKDRWRTMRTPKEYTENIKNGIITKQMLSDCIFSVNKRAEYWRDKQREYKELYEKPWEEPGWRYDMERAKELKERYYEAKDSLLKVIEPKCIHRERKNRIKYVRIREYEPEYQSLREKFCHKGSYWDRDICDYVAFGDLAIETSLLCYNYYLFYDLGFGHTFHKPIEFNVDEVMDKLDDYPELDVEEIDTIVTSEYNKDDLLPYEFVVDVVSLIRSGKYTIIDDIES